MRACVFPTPQYLDIPMDIYSGNKDSGKRFEMIALCGNVWNAEIHSQPFHNNRNNKLRLLSVAATI